MCYCILYIYIYVLYRTSVCVACESGILIEMPQVEKKKDTILLISIQVYISDSNFQSLRPPSHREDPSYMPYCFQARELRALSYTRMNFLTSETPWGMVVFIKDKKAETKGYL